jgi:hypothetical protein
MLEDAQTAVGSIDPLSRFGSSAFGPVRVRAISADGAAGDWLTLGTLVRTPGFKDLRCPRSLTKPCLLSGTNLFLANSIAATSDFASPTDVPPDFTGTQVIVPHPTGGVLYLKLRDDPATVQTLTLPVVPITQPAEAAAIKSQPSSIPAPPPASGPPEASPHPAADTASEPSTPPANPPPADAPKQQPAPPATPATESAPATPHAAASPNTSSFGPHAS